MRLQPAPVAIAPAAVLSPLVSRDTNLNMAAQEPAPPVEPPAVKALTPEAEPLVTAPAGEEAATNFVSSILGPLISTPEQPLLTPQMLLPYFRDIQGGTNRDAVVVPLTFVPPLPAEKLSSKATYIVTPPLASPK